MTATAPEGTWQEILLNGAPDAALAEKVRAGINELLLKDGDLLMRDVNERTITGRLADHLRPRFPEWDVDPEYNRDGHEVKKANGEIVVPDIIVHRRGTPDNLLVVEAKKSNTPNADEDVLAKLALYKTCHLQYRHALFIKFLVGPGAPAIERLEWV